MLNKNSERELCYIVQIDDIKPIEGRDRVECAVVGGWTCMVPKGAFTPGSLGIYFEIDSKVDETKEVFAFTAKYHGKIKTQKFKTPSGQFWSQGLLMSPSDFGWITTVNSEGQIVTQDDEGKWHTIDDESRFLTKELGVTYAVTEDNKRKAKSDPNAKYKSMFSRHPKFARSKFGRWCGRHMWAKKLLYLFWGKKKIDNAKNFPTHLPHIHKSDEERIENLVFLLSDKDEWVKTTKIDGTSSLFLLERKPFNKFEYWVCSRNVRQIDRNQECYHDDNVYWEVNDKYNIENVLRDILKNHPEWSYVAIQGESAGCSSSGAKIQGDPHNFKELRFFAYNFITSDIGRWGSVEGENFLKEYDIPWVPIIDTHYVLPDDFEELKASATGPCEADGANGLREGYVYRRASFKDGVINSFKNVSREYLLKNN